MPSGEAANMRRALDIELCDISFWQLFQVDGGFYSCNDALPVSTITKLLPTSTDSYVASFTTFSFSVDAEEMAS